jgi:hypothetical protein
MALDASSQLGAPQVAGVQIQRLGTYKQTVGGLGGAGTMKIASLILRFAMRGKLAAERDEAVASDAPDFGVRAYLALSDEDLAIVAVTVGSRLALGDVLVRVHRSEVVSATLGDKAGMPLGSPPLMITLRDGRRWLFETPRVTRRLARTLVTELSEQPAGIRAEATVTRA